MNKRISYRQLMRFGREMVDKYNNLADRYNELGKVDKALHAQLKAEQAHSRYLEYMLQKETEKHKRAEKHLYFLPPICKPLPPFVFDDDNKLIYKEE